MATIGGITVQFIEAISLSDGRRNQVIDIPYGPQTGFAAGGQLSRYSLRSHFYGTTLAQAKAVRSALRSLVKDYNQDVVKIVFDIDNNELDGWFLIDSLDTDIEGATNSFSFTMSASRLGGVAGAVDALTPAVYYQSDPITSNCWTAQEWISLPGDEAADETVETYTGDVGIGLTPTNPTVFSSASTVFDSDCRIYDTVEALTDPEQLEGSGSGWNVISSPSDATGGIVFDNGLLRVAWQQLGYASAAINFKARNYSIAAYSPTQNLYSLQIYGFTFYSSAPTIPSPYNPQTYNALPQIVEKSDSRIVWQQRFMDMNINEPAYHIRFTMVRGQPWLGMKVYAQNAAFYAKSSFAYSFFETSVTNDFKSAVGGCWCANIRKINTEPGFLIGVIKANSDSSAHNDYPDYNLSVNIAIAEGETKDFALLIAETSLATSSTAAQREVVISPYAKRYVAGMSQQSVLVTPESVF